MGGEIRRRRKTGKVEVNLYLEKVYDRVNWETIWQVLRIHDMGGKLLSEIKSMYVNT